MLQEHALHAALRRWRGDDGNDFREFTAFGIGDGRFADLDVRIDTGNRVVRDILRNDDAVRDFVRVRFMHGHGHLHREVVDVPEGTFLEDLEAPYGSPHLADFVGWKVLFARGGLDGLVEARSVEVAQVFRIGAGTQTHTGFAIKPAHLGIESFAEGFFDGDVLEHVADVVEHRFAEARIGDKVFAGNQRRNVVAERCSLRKAQGTC